jgi:transposase
VIRTSLNKRNGGAPQKVNLYFQDESRFGLMTYMGRCLTAKGIKPVVKYQHRFASTYLWGAYSPIDGNHCTVETDSVNKQSFQYFLDTMAAQRPEEHKIMVIDNAGFHSTKDLHVPDNITLLNIPPYSPELNPCEQIWQHLKKMFRNEFFESIPELSKWLWQKVNELTKEQIASITSNYHYLEAFIRVFK